ncbi:24910_t:CDS:2, partial [Dentiscutata erythropus]
KEDKETKPNKKISNYFHTLDSPQHKQDQPLHISNQNLLYNDNNRTPPYNASSDIFTPLQIQQQSSSKESNKQDFSKQYTSSH